MIISTLPILAACSWGFTLVSAAVFIVFLLGMMTALNCVEIEEKARQLEIQNAQRLAEIETLQRRVYALEVGGFQESLKG